MCWSAQMTRSAVHRSLSPGAKYLRIAPIVVIDPELIGHGQKQRAGVCDRFVLLELRNEDVRLGRVAAAEDGALTSLGWSLR
jgi:hypothetical protein